MILALLLVLGTWWLWRMKTPGLGRYDLLLAWGIKIVASLVLLWIYTYYYGWNSLTADPNVFMKESAMLAAVAGESFPDYLRFLFGFETTEMVHHYLSETSHWSAGDLNVINDSRNVIRINSLLHFISGGYPILHFFTFSFLSLLGMRELYLAFYFRTSYSPRWFWLGLVLLPSVLFWTSSMLKEPLLIVGMCLLLHGFLGKLTTKARTWRIILGFLLMLLFKPYVLICLIPAVLFYLVTRHVFKGKIVWSLVGCFSFVAVLLLVLPGKRSQMTDYLTRKQYDFINIGRGGLHAYADTCFFYFTPDQFQYIEFRPDSTVYLKRPLMAKQVTMGRAAPFKDVYLYPNKKRWFNYYETQGCKSNIVVTPIESSFTQLLLNIPEAFVNAAFRPFFGDPGGFLKYPALVETLLLFTWFFLQFRFWRNVPHEQRLVFVSLLIFAVMLFVLIGWTTPVLGAIVRYRIPAYLALFLAGMLLHHPKRMHHE